MKNLLSLLAIASLVLFWSCSDSDNDDDDDNPQPTEQSVSGPLETQTWTTGSTITLAGRTIVPEGAVLTIEPGVVVKGAAGEGTQASVLVVAQGGQIFANGTSEAPIIFTSAADGITPGNVTGTLGVDDQELWGGLIILGRAPISADAETALIEGLPADEAFGIYGGSDANDNSGVLNYVSIRHGGILIGEGNEINGLTLGGVGAGTTITNVEVVGNEDDGIEWFGGTVNVENALVWGADDDAIDIDQAYAGLVNNALVIAVDGVTDHALEIDGPEGTLIDGFTLTNVTIIGNDQEPADFRDCAVGSINNLYITGYSADPTIDGEGDFSLSDPTDDAGNVESTCTTDNFGTGDLSFSNIEITTNFALADIFKNFSNADIETIVTQVDEGAATVGANTSVFDGWTLASASSAY